MNKQNLTLKEAMILGVQHQQKSNFEEAKKIYQNILKIYPNQATVANNLGLVFVGLEEYQEAKACYERAIELDPNHPDANNNLGTLFRRHKEYQKAKSCFEKAIQSKPDYTTAHNNLGSLLNQLGDFEKAKSCYKKAIELNPNNATSYNNLGSVFAGLKKHQEAKVCYEKAIELDPNYSEANNSIGLFFRKNKEFKKAADYFKKVDTVLANAQFLECIYFSNELENYNKLLDTFSKTEPTNRRIAALAAYVSKKENIKNIYPFCKNPLDYFFSTNLKNEFKSPNQFSSRLLKILEKSESIWQPKPILIKGYQSTGNLLDNPIFEISELKKKIEKQINIYRDKYKHSKDYFISRWPAKSNLFGWHIKLKKQGQLTSHMHEYGWLSGVFYLKVPKPLNKNEGSINLKLIGYDYPYDKNLPNLLYDPKPFDLILYPSSLFHSTVPFTSNEERHSFAFDLNPK